MNLAVHTKRACQCYFHSVTGRLNSVPQHMCIARYVTVSVILPDRHSLVLYRNG